MATQTATQTEYHVIKVCRSDGCDTGPGYWPVEAPKPAKKATKDGPEKATRTKPQMVRLAEDDPRFIEWRVKLGILLKQEISPYPNEGLPWYVDFPRGYWLYERSRSLWVSGYPVKSKLFKSPQDFGVHILWLFSSSSDRRDCCCVHCNVPSPGRVTPAPDDVAKKAGSEPPQDRTTPYAKAVADLSASNVPVSALTPQARGQLETLPGGPLATAQLSPAPTPASNTPVSQTSTVGAPAQAPAQPQSQTQPQIQSQPQIQPQPQGQSQPQHQIQSQPQIHPQPQGQAQQQGQIPQSQVQPQGQGQLQNQGQPQQVPQARPQVVSSLLFRTGELVWYTNGPSWRLGLLTQSANGSHQILPIGHSRARQPVVAKQDSELRPFQAFTVPPVSTPDLKGRTYDEIPWDAILGNLTGDATKDLGVILLDASKLAALKIDQSFSLFGKLGQKDNTSSYRGVFLGAERIEVGDTLRVVTPPPLAAARAVYFGLKMIISQDQPGGKVLLFRGMFYQLREWNEAPQPAGSILDDALPPALREESTWRRSVAPDRPLSWHALTGDVWLKEGDVKGRFYPTHMLAPILTPSDFAMAVARGDRTAVVPALNGRLDSAAGATKNIGWRLNRLVTAGEAIPHDAMFGFESQVREEVEGQ